MINSSRNLGKNSKKSENSAFLVKHFEKQCLLFFEKPTLFFFVAENSKSFRMLIRLNRCLN